MIPVDDIPARKCIPQFVLVLQLLSKLHPRFRQLEQDRPQVRVRCLVRHQKAVIRIFPAILRISHKAPPCRGQFGTVIMNDGYPVDKKPATLRILLRVVIRTHIRRISGGRQARILEGECGVGVRLRASAGL